MNGNEAINAAATAVGGISNYWQVIALVIIGAFGVLALWITRVGGESKKLVAKSDELERERTENRRIARDNQIAALDSKVTGIGASLDKHKDEHKDRDIETIKNIASIDNRLRVIEGGLIPRGKFEDLQDKMHNIDLTVREIHTVIKERLK